MIYAVSSKMFLRALFLREQNYHNAYDKIMTILQSRAFPVSRDLLTPKLSGEIF